MAENLSTRSSSTDFSSHPMKQYMPSLKSQILFFLALILVYTILAVIFTYPLVFHLGDSIIGRQNSLCFYYLDYHVANQILVEHNFSFFSWIKVPQMHPYPHPLRFGPQGLANLLFYMPYFALTYDPVKSYNLMILTFFVLTPLGAFYFFNYIFKDKRASFFGSIIFGFTAYRLSSIEMTANLLLLFSFLCLLFLIKFINTGKVRYVFLFYLFFILEYFCFLYKAFYLFLIIIILLAFQYRHLFDRKKLVYLIIGGIAGLLLISPHLYFYLNTKFEYDISANWLLSGIFQTNYDFLSILRIRPTNFLYGEWWPGPKLILDGRSFYSNLTFFPGFLVSFFFFYALFTRAFVLEIDKKFPRYFFLFSFLFFLLWGLGIPINLNGEQIRVPLLFFIIIKLFPLINTFRVLTRVLPWIFIGFSFIAASGMLKLFKSIDKKSVKVVSFLIIIFLTLLENQHRVKLFPAKGLKNSFPSYEFLKDKNRNSEKFAIVEIPGYWYKPASYHQPSLNEKLLHDDVIWVYLFQSLLIDVPTCDAFISFFPDSMKIPNIQYLPDPVARQYAAAFDVRYVVVHKDILDVEFVKNIEKKFEANNMKLLASFNRNDIYFIPDKVMTTNRLAMKAEIKQDTAILRFQTMEAFYGRVLKKDEIPIIWTNPHLARMENIVIYFEDTRGNRQKKNVRFRLPLALYPDITVNKTVKTKIPQSLTRPVRIVSIEPQDMPYLQIIHY